MSNRIKKETAGFGANIGLKYKLIILVSLLYTVFAAIVNYMTFSNASGALLKETLSVMISNLTQINNNINYNAKHHEIALNAFCSASKLDHYLTSRQADNEEEFLVELKQSILSFKGANPNVIDLKIFTYNENLPTDDYTVFDIGSFRTASLLNDILDVASGVSRNEPSMYSSTVWSNVGDGTWNKFGYIPAVYCYKALYDDARLKPIAIIRMDVTMQSVFSGIEAERLSKNLPGEFFVANTNANIISSSADVRLGLYQYKSRVQEAVKRREEQGYFN